MNEQQQQRQMLENSTTFLSLIDSSSSSPADRTRTMINVIYILGIVFMVVVFLILLWINLYSRRCWCWHDTPLIHRFNRQWLIQRSMKRNRDMSSATTQRQRTSLNDDELQF